MHFVFGILGSSVVYWLVIITPFLDKDENEFRFAIKNSRNT